VKTYGFQRLRKKLVGASSGTLRAFLRFMTRNVSIAAINGAVTRTARKSNVSSNLGA
jgi:hypothetical protein